MLAVKSIFFHLMPYPELPPDFPEQHRSVWVDIDPKLYDPTVGHQTYNTYLDQLEFAAGCGFDAVGIKRASLQRLRADAQPEHHRCGPVAQLP